MKFSVFLFLLGSLGAASEYITFPRARRSAAPAWPSGAYCILQGGTSCPPGFASKSIRLSVQQNYKPSDSLGDGRKAIQTGAFGASELKSLKFDDAYALDLLACCKDS